MDTTAQTGLIERAGMATRRDVARPDRASSDKIDNAPPQELLQGFSLAMAAQKLQSRASLSLKMHGATPDNTSLAAGTGVGERARDTVSAGASLAEKGAQIDKRASGDGPENQSRLSANATEPAPAKPAAASVLPETVKAAPAAMLGQTAAAALLTAQTPREAAVPRDAAATRNSLPNDMQRLRNTARSAEPQPAQQDFARLIAKRINNATTAFDIRLDPPELGRVEGRFAIADDGKAVLSLKFDNQAAFDLFARDEAALRTALENAGLDLGSHDLDLSFADFTEHSPVASASIAIDQGVSDVEPVFAAPYSAGAVDLRV